MRLATRQVLLLPALLLMLACPSAWAKDKKDDISKIGKRNIAHKSIIPVEKERAVGRQYAKEIESRAKLITDPVVVQYVDQVAQKVAQNSDLKIPLVVKVIDSPKPDGLILPGGFIYAYSGLIRIANSEGELAALLAFGIADIAARHWASTQTKVTILHYATIPNIFTPVTYGACYGVMQSYMNGGDLSSLKFSREDVVESDYFALQYLYKAGYDPESYIAVLERFAKIEDTQPTPPKVFQDRPPARERMANCRKEIANILPPRMFSPPPNDEFEKVKGLLLTAAAPTAAP